MASRPLDVASAVDRFLALPAPNVVVVETFLDLLDVLLPASERGGAYVSATPGAIAALVRCAVVAGDDPALSTRVAQWVSVLPVTLALGRMMLDDLARLGVPRAAAGDAIAAVLDEAIRHGLAVPSADTPVILALLAAPRPSLQRVGLVLVAHSLPTLAAAPARRLTAAALGLAPGTPGVEHVIAAVTQQPTLVDALDVRDGLERHAESLPALAPDVLLLLASDPKRAQRLVERMMTLGQCTPELLTAAASLPTVPIARSALERLTTHADVAVQRAAKGLLAHGDHPARTPDR